MVSKNTIDDFADCAGTVEVDNRLAMTEMTTSSIEAPITATAHSQPTSETAATINGITVDVNWPSVSVRHSRLRLAGCGGGITCTSAK